jgi:carboxylesterase
MHPSLINAHLEGESFDWPGGDTGILLLHGFTATTAEVRPLARRLHASRGYSLAGPLLPGHGTTPDDLNRCRWVDWVDAAEAAYCALAARCRTVLVGGESMGAMLALNVASRRPEVAGLLLFAPAIWTNASLGDVARVAAMSPFVPHLKKQKGPRTAVDEAWQGYDVRPTRAVLEFFRLQFETRRRLPRVTQPVLTVQARLDATVHPVSGALISAGVSSQDQERHWMDHSTHCVILDQELPQVAEITLRFVARVLGGGRA